MRVFLLRRDEWSGNVYKLSKKERNYLFSVLRLHVNDTFTAKDCAENYYKAFLFDEETITLEHTDNPEETLLDGLSSYKGPFADLAMYISVLKGKKNETEIRMLTEIGVKEIILIETEFVQDNLNAHALERIKLIIREAVQQSGSREPVLRGPMSFEEAIEEEEKGRILILHQSMLTSSVSIKQAISDCTQSDRIAAFIGPEGGFSDKECSLALSKGALPVLLQTNILRAETAAVYTAAAIQTLIH